MKSRLEKLEKSADFQQPEKESGEEYGLQSLSEFDEVVGAFVHSFEAIYEIDWHTITGDLLTEEEGKIFWAVLEQFKAGKLVEGKHGLQLNPELWAAYRKEKRP
jgi:hypothetical protein